MKIKDLFKKVEQANELAKMFNGNEYIIAFTDGITFHGSFSNYKAFSKFVRDTYIKCCADDLLECEINYDKDVTIHGYVFDEWNEMHEMNVELNVEMI